MLPIQQDPEAVDVMIGVSPPSPRSGPNRSVLMVRFFSEISPNPQGSVDPCPTRLPFSQNPTQIMFTGNESVVLRLSPSPICSRSQPLRTSAFFRRNCGSHLFQSPFARARNPMVHSPAYFSQGTPSSLVRGDSNRGESEER